MKTPIILHIPHSSPVIPQEVRGTFLLADDELKAELLRQTDSHTEELYTGYASPAVQPLVYPVSRLVVDPERFPEDADEPMARHGLGVVYLKTQDGKTLRRPLADGERRLLLDTYYHPHHRRLLKLVSERLDRHGLCLIIDCHSFPHEPFPFEEGRARGRPDVCVGADSFHTPERLKNEAVDYFRGAGYSVDVNHPFAGALVPLAYYRKEAGVLSLMIEINRKLYMDERTGEKTGHFASLQRQLGDFIRSAAGS